MKGKSIMGSIAIAMMLMWACLLSIIVTCTRAETVKVDRSLYLDIHNDYRRKAQAANMMQLVWSDEAEKAASQWAKTCTFEHQNKGWGENLAFNAMPSMASVKAKIVDMMKQWHDEIKLYRHGDSCGSACHYTQMVWAQTTQVGCTLEKCNPFTFFGQKSTLDSYYLVCFYKTKGNAPMSPFLKGAVCSKCPSGTKCVNGLCSSGKGGSSGSTGGGNGSTGGGDKDTGKGTSGEEATGPDAGKGTDGKGDGYIKEEPDTGKELEENEKKELLSLHNEIRKMDGKSPLVWNTDLQQMADIIVNCETQYPATPLTYSNYQRYKTGGLRSVINAWSKEKLSGSLNGKGCYGLNRSLRCNHHLNIISGQIMACAARDCVTSGRQLTCIYR